MLVHEVTAYTCMYLVKSCVWVHEVKFIYFHVLGEVMCVGVCGKCIYFHILGEVMCLGA